jgi:hypothetical protein
LGEAKVPSQCWLRMLCGSLMLTLFIVIRIKNKIVGLVPIFKRILTH